MHHRFMRLGALALLAATATVAVAATLDRQDPAHGTGGEAFAQHVTAPLNGDAAYAQSPRMPTMSELGARGSYVFPPGTTYRQAVTSLYMARQAGNALPAAATRGPALPAGKVVVIAGDGGLAVDAAAPIGYDVATGIVQDPGYSLPGSMSADEVQARAREARAHGWPLPRGATVIVPPLPRCQVLLKGEDVSSHPPCTPGDVHSPLVTLD